MAWRTNPFYFARATRKACAENNATRFFSRFSEPLGAANLFIDLSHSLSQIAAAHFFLHMMSGVALAMACHGNLHMHVYVWSCGVYTKGVPKEMTG